MSLKQANLLANVVLIGGILAFRSVLADQYLVPTGSMEPTIQPGDHIAVNKLAYDLRVPFTQLSLLRTADPERGDVIVFQDPRDSSTTLVKRLVGLPGDHVRITDGVVELNSEPLETNPNYSPEEVESRLATAQEPIQYEERIGSVSHLVQRLPHLPRNEAQDFIVPPHHYLVLGDNRDNSADSRVWGLVHRDALKGKAVRVLYTVRWEGALPSVDIDRAGQAL